jgi:hypothetical protein
VVVVVVVVEEVNHAASPWIGRRFTPPPAVNLNSCLQKSTSFRRMGRMNAYLESQVILGLSRSFKKYIRISTLSNVCGQKQTPRGLLGPLGTFSCLYYT